MGLPTEGVIGDARRISRFTRPAPSVDVDDTIAAMQAFVGVRFAVVVTGPGGVLLGALQPAAAALASSTPVADAMIPAPGTIRPELRVEEASQQLRGDGLDHVFVTAVDGVLIGLVVTDELHV